MLKQKIQNRVMNSSPYQLIFKKQQEKASKISDDKIDTSPFEPESHLRENYPTCPTEANKLETDPPSPIANGSEPNTTIHEYINMLGAVDSKPLEEFTPRKRETYSDANQFFQDSPDLRKALLQEPLEIADMENIIPMRKGSLSDPKGESTELVNTAKEPESATRNRRPGGPTASTVLVKSPSGRGERMEAANDKIASKVSVSKGSFCSSNQKSTTSTTASRISKNGLDKPGTPIDSKAKLPDTPNKVPPPRLQYKGPEYLPTTDYVRSPKVTKSSANSKQVHSPVIKEQKYGLVLQSKSKMERTRQDSQPSMNSISNLANNTAVYTLKQSNSCVSPSRNVEVLVTPRGNKKIIDVFKQMDIKVELGLSSEKPAPRDRIVGKHKKSNSKPEIPKPKLNSKPFGTKSNLYDDVVPEEYDPSEAYLTEFELIVDSLKAKIKENRIEIFEDEKLRAGLMHLKSLASINLAALRSFKA